MDIDAHEPIALRTHIDGSRATKLSPAVLLITVVCNGQPGNVAQLVRDQTGNCEWRRFQCGHSLSPSRTGGPVGLVDYFWKHRQLCAHLNENRATPTSAYLLATWHAFWTHGSVWSRRVTNWPTRHALLVMLPTCTLALQSVENLLIVEPSPLRAVRFTASFLRARAAEGGVKRAVTGSLLFLCPVALALYQQLAKMPKARVNAQIDTPTVDVLVDMGHPLLNRIVDGFVKVGGVGAVHAASQETYKFILEEQTNKKSLENMVSRIGKETVQWGLVAGVYSGMTYGMQEARGVHDWKNALFGGALTGAALALTESNPRSDSVVRGAITGGAIATAAEFLRSLTN